MWPSVDCMGSSNSGATSTYVFEYTIIINNENLIKEYVDIYVGGRVSETRITGGNAGCYLS